MAQIKTPRVIFIYIAEIKTPQVIFIYIAQIKTPQVTYVYTICTNKNTTSKLYLHNILKNFYLYNI